MSTGISSRRYGERDTANRLRPRNSPGSSTSRRWCWEATTKPCSSAQSAPQIAPVYETDFRSTPVFFLQDDHDYFDNDEATDEIVTFPPSHFMLALARATQLLYYPEFLPDAARPLGLPWSSTGDRVWGVSESFGTLRYGRLGRGVALRHPSHADAGGAERRLCRPRSREMAARRAAAATEVTHVVHAPSNPPGWTAGKWGEWYPDVLGRRRQADGQPMPKPYWQSGWLKQHDRLMAAMSAMKGRVAARHQRRHARGRDRADAAQRHARSHGQSGQRRAVRSGRHAAARLAVRSASWHRRACRSTHLDLDEQVKPIEQHGFTLVDFTPDKMVRAAVQMGRQYPTGRGDGYTASRSMRAELIRPT